MRVRVEGRLRPGVSAKDIILALIAEIGIAGGTGHVFEYTGRRSARSSMEERMTVCNMSIEGGARAGMIAPDDTTFEYLAGRPHAPQGAAWDAAVARLAHAADATTARRYDRDDRRSTPSTLAPDDHLRHQPGHGRCRSPARARPALADAGDRRRSRRRSATWACTPGQPLLGHSRSTSSSSGSCTNAPHLATCDWRRSVLRGRHVAPACACWSCPARSRSSAQAEAEGLDDVFSAAGAEWREAGCSMCIAMNGDSSAPGQYAVSTSNRNFEGRQGKGARTFLASPLTAAATAVAASSPTPATCSR